MKLPRRNNGKIRVLGVIPARLDSTRLPRKMLSMISGKPLIYYTWKQALKAKTLDAVVIATDSEEIFEVAKNFGAEVMMTSSDLNSGTERTAEALKKFKDFSPDIVVNIQGDEPLIPPLAIDSCVEAIKKDENVLLSTPITPFKNEADRESPNFVKAVIDRNGDALYFSRSLLPYPRAPFENFMKHLGLYAFRKDFLLRYIKLPETPLEKAEKLEQLRVLENGYKIRTVKGDFDNIEVNTPEELERVRVIIEKGIKANV